MNTQGPWVIRGDAIESEREVICLLTGPADTDEIAARMEADARLIAAAPDLLAALQEAVAIFSERSFDIQYGDTAPFGRMRAAIAKATS